MPTHRVHPTHRDHVHQTLEILLETERNLRDQITRINKKILDLAPDLTSEERDAIDTTGWLFWLWRAIQGGQAKVLSGRLPDDPPKPRKMLEEEQAANQTKDIGVLASRLTALLEKQGQVLEKVAGVFTSR